MNQIISLKALNYNANYSYAPPVESKLVNVADISTVTETDARGLGCHSLIKMKTGEVFTVEGSPDDIEGIIKK
jgi:hypothetical protein